MGEGENNVEIVNHEVENDIDIQGAGREDTETVRLKKHGPRKMRLDGENGRVESHKMAGLQDAPFLFGLANEVVCLIETGRERLFHEQIEAGFEQSRRNGVMLHGGHGHAGGMNVKFRGEQFFGSCKDGNGELRGCFLRTDRVGLDGGNESDAEAGSLKLAQNAQMIAAECAGAGDGNTHNIAWRRLASGRFGHF
jgi:hypothetical protein